MERTLSPYDIVSPRTVLGWVGGAALRGDLAPSREFLARGRRVAHVKRELAGLRKTLARTAA